MIRGVNADHHRRPRYSGTHPRRFGERYKEHATAAFPDHTAHLREKGKTPASTHVPVMVAEVMARLALKPGATIVDATLGYGGHATAILERITAASSTGRLIGLDVEGVELPKTVARLREKFGDALRPHRMRFAGIGKALALEGVAAVDGILADLGVSSMQLDDPARGFSVKRDGPLDLRMDDRLKRSGAELVNALEEEQLAALLRELADEPDAEKIAGAIVEQRTRRPFTRTGELSAAILAAKGITRDDHRADAEGRGRTVHPAARTFQALRMAVNDELGNLTALLRVAPACLTPGGRLVVITFHGGEERLVAAALRGGLARGDYVSISESPERPTAEELHANPRASSARLSFAIRAA